MVSLPNNGLVSLRSRFSAAETLARLEQLLASKGIKLFVVIDHSGEAEKAGFQMPPCKLVIFGNPKAGTPLMIANPAIALDLPLKILVYEKDDGTVWVTYNSPLYLQNRYDVPPDLMTNISGIDALAASVVE